MAITQTSNQSLIEQFRNIGPTTPLTDTLILSMLRAIDTRFLPLQAQRSALDEAIEAVRNVGLERINEVLIPAIESVHELLERGFLIARSSSPGTLANGNVLTLVIEDEDERRLFSPAPFVALTREANADDYAVALTNSYERDGGVLVVTVLSWAGSPGPHSDWVIGALAGSSAAGQLMLTQTEAARNLAADWAEKPAGQDVAGVGTRSAKAHAAAASSAATSAGATRDETIAARNATTDARDVAIAARNAAEQHAANAALFDPSSYYTKTLFDTGAVELDGGSFE